MSRSVAAKPPRHRNVALDDATFAEFLTRKARLQLDSEERVTTITFVRALFKSYDETQGLKKQLARLQKQNREQ